MGVAVGGLVSGMDSASIISKLLELERRPVTLLENKRTTLSNEKAAWQEISTRMLALKTASNDMATLSNFSSKSATFISNSASAATALTVTAASNATSGTYGIKVNQLAQSQKSATDQSFTSSTSALGLIGTLSIGATDISITETATLGGIKDLINNSGAGVTANIFNAGTTASPQYRLMVSGSELGAANAFTIGYGDITMTDNILSFTDTQSAQDASVTFDGVATTKSSNTINDLITGATINLQAAGSGTITMATDTNGVVTKVQNFVDKYNSAMDYIKEQLAYDQTNKTKGTLFGNSTLMSMQNQLRSIVSGSVSGLDPTDPAIISSLAQVGIMTDINNQMTLDTAAFQDALASDFDQVARLFANSGSGSYNFIASSGFTQGGVYDTKVEGGVLKLRISGSTGDWTSLTQDGNYAFGVANTILDGLLLQTGALTEGATGAMTLTGGISTRVQSYTSRYTEFSTEGLIYNQNKSIETRDQEFQDEITNLTNRLTEKETNLKAKFTQLEVLLAKMSSQQTYLTQQLSGIANSVRR
ncbi:MAG: flagellar filament capping protein FliD [Nitrospinae bacterium]|nr:flagellar filament capping protein FliD [Nitrospinota bacterium]MBF0633302.1 flagellar filament capping protein FliD [Nitrospinota bacterium]